jgi:hypothetical protein
MTTAEFFAARHAELEAGVRRILAEQEQQTASHLARQLGAGMRELDRVLQQMRKDGVIVTQRRWWRLA